MGSLDIHKLQPVLIFHAIGNATVTLMDVCSTCSMQIESKGVACERSDR